MLGITLNGSAPIYEQISKQIENFILIGVLEPNESLPSVRELATELMINPNTVQKAYAILEQNGAAYSVSGKGRFVTDNIEKLKNSKKETAMEDLKAVLESLQKKEITKNEILQFVNNYFEGK